MGSKATNRKYSFDIAVVFFCFDLCPCTMVICVFVLKNRVVSSSFDLESWWSESLKEFQKRLNFVLCFVFNPKHRPFGNGGTDRNGN